MKIATKNISVHGQKLTITNQRVLYWEKYSALILSDLHVGKTAHFRKNGIPIPNNILSKDLNRLSVLIKYFSAEKLIFTGDLLHAGDNKDVDFFCEWKKELAEINFILVKGNHDKFSKSLSEKLNIKIHNDYFILENVCFIHEFDENLPFFQISGHIHPGIIIPSSVKNIILPGFILTEKQLLMPAFSEFTGLDTKNLPLYGKFFAFTSNEIYEL